MSNALTATVTHTVVDSPYGPLTLVGTGSELSGLYMTEHRHRPAEETSGARDERAVVSANMMVRSGGARSMSEARQARMAVDSRLPGSRNGYRVFPQQGLADGFPFHCRAAFGYVATATTRR